MFLICMVSHCIFSPGEIQATVNTASLTKTHWEASWWQPLIWRHVTIIRAGNLPGKQTSHFNTTEYVLLPYLRSYTWALQTND